MPFQDYSTSPSANTTIGEETFIGPNMPRNNVRQALQQLAADGKDLSNALDTIVTTGLNTDPLLRANLASVGGSALTGFIQSGTGSVARTVENKLRETVSVKDFRNLSEPDDTGAFVRASAYLTPIGGRLHVPAGNYNISGPIVSDSSGQTGVTEPRMTLLGDGARSTIINVAAGDFDALTFIGSNGAAADAVGSIEGINLSKDGHLGKTLVIKQYSHIAVRDIKINGGYYGLYGSDLQESHFENVLCSFALKGALIEPGAFTAPNAHTFLNCKMGPNFHSGLEVVNCGLLNIIGGSYESNQCTVPAIASFGIRVNWTSAFQIESAVGLNVWGAYIEQNGHIGARDIATGDIWIQNDAGPMAVSILGTTFNRLGHYCINNIRVENSGTYQNSLTINGNGHRSFPFAGGYTPDAGRPAVLIANPQYVLVNEGVNIYADAIERPYFKDYNNLTHGAMAQAHFLFDGTGATGVKAALEKFNIASITKLSAGTYNVVFGRAMPTSAYLPVFSLESDLRHAVTARTTGGFNFTVRNGSGTLTDDGAIGAVIFGAGY